jgi:hypothetical protein
MIPLWSGGEPPDAAPDPEPPRRHARLYEAEYAKQLRRMELIRKAVGGGDTPEPSRHAHRSWDEPPVPAPRQKPPEEDARPARDAHPVARTEPAEPAAPPPQPPIVAAGEAGHTPPAAARPPRREDPKPVTRLRSLEPRKPSSPVNAAPARLAGGWKPPRPEQPAAAPSERRPVTLFASGLALLGIAALAIALLSSRQEKPQAKLMPLPSAATDLVAGGGRLWVAAPQAGAVWMLDDETGDPLAPALRTGGTPARIALGDDGAWAADTEHGALVRVRRSRVSAPVSIGPDVSDVAFAGNAVWAASAADGMVRVLPAGARRPRAFAVGGHPVALAADERNVVVASADGAVSWFDARTRRGVATIRVGGTPIAAAMDRGAAWIADASRGTVQRIALQPGDRGTGVASERPISVGSRPVAVAARDGLVYVVSRDRTLAVVDEHKGVVKRSVPLGVDPAAIAVDSEYVWVAAAGRNALARIDRRRLS